VVAESSTVEAQAQSVRRMAGLGLAAVVAAAATAATIALTHDDRHRPDATALLPVTFAEPGFVDGRVHRGEATAFAPSTQVGSISVRPLAGQPAYVVVRCDTGTATVTLPPGEATGDVATSSTVQSSQACSGRAVGVLALDPRTPVSTLRVAVSRAQRGPWGVGIYR